MRTDWFFVAVLGSLAFHILVVWVWFYAHDPIEVGQKVDQTAITLQLASVSEMKTLRAPVPKPQRQSSSKAAAQQRSPIPAKAPSTDQSTTSVQTAKKAASLEPLIKPSISATEPLRNARLATNVQTTKKGVDPEPIIKKIIESEALSSLPPERHKLSPHAPETIQSSGSHQGQSGPTQQQTALNEYAAQLALWLHQHQQYPKRAIRRRLEGRVVLSLTVSSEHQLMGVELERSSGHRLLDQAALMLLEKRKGFPVFPDVLDQPSYQFTVPIVYVLQ